MTLLADAPVAITPSTANPAASAKLVRTWFLFLPLLYYANGGNIGPSPAATHQAGLLLASLVAAFLVFKRFAVVSAAILRLKLIIALPILAVLSSLWSVDKGQTIISAIPFLCFTLFAVYWSETFTVDEQFDLIVKFGALAVTASIALAVLVPSVGTLEAGWCGIFGHKQPCAADSTFFLVTALHWKPTHPLGRSLKWVYILLCLFLIIMSQSRTGWLLALVAIGLSGALWILQKFVAKDGLFVVVTAVPLLGGLGYLVVRFASLIITSVGKDPTLSQRTIIWAAVWDEIARRLWQGYGYNAFWQGLKGSSHEVVLIAGWAISQAQSGYLDLWVQLGVFAIIILLLTTTQAAKNCMNSFRYAQNPAFVRWAVVIIAVNLVYNVGESEVGAAKLSWFLFLLACIGLKNQALAKT